MRRNSSFRLRLAGGVLLLAVTTAAGPPKLKLASIQVAPGDFSLDGRWASQRLVVTGILADGSRRDVTAAASFRSADSKIAAVNKSGLVTPVRDGATVISLSVAGQKRKVRVTVTGASRKLASFRNSVEPVLGQAGCNSAACHGAQRGQGSLRLSLFGGEPEADYDALVRNAAGRRINRTEPRQSLVLLKAAGGVPHSGGARLAPGSRGYDILTSWLDQGAPWDSEADAAIVSLSIYPGDRTLRKGETHRLLVTAAFANGAVRDVTAEAVFHSSDPRVATVADAEVKAAGTGDAAIVVTYLRKAAVVRVAVPQTPPANFPPLQANNQIDGLVYAKLAAMGIPPSELSTGPGFLRRVYLDTIGILPTPAEARGFLADRDPQKRAKLIDGLLGRDEFNDFWSLKWGDLLRIKSEYPVRVWPKAVAVYYQWLHQSLAENKPYDQFARELITATGSNFRVGPANFVRAVANKDPRTVAESAALVFMGARLGCARCHSHPYESWTPGDVLALGAWFGRVNYKSTLEWKEEIVYLDFKANLRDPRTRQVVEPRVPAGDPVKVGPEEDARIRFAAWLTAPDNPWFAANMVNRIWFWLMGTGIVNEPDDMRPTNPPTNPQLLEYLQKELVDSHYDLRHIYRLILNSRTYQLSSEPNEWNAADTAHFARYAARRLSAEQMLDAVSQFTETNEAFRSIIPEPFSNWPSDTRASQISDGNTECAFLDMFGRPPRDTPYEEERDNALTLRQTLYFLNSEQLEGKLSSSPRLKRLLASKQSDADVVDEIYLAALSRFPSDEERKRVLEYLGARKAARAQAVQDVAWAVLNAKEFLFNH
jgi:uncharacterized protein YjdB